MSEMEGRGLWVKNTKDSGSGFEISVPTFHQVVTP